jgi:hypothetical protein
VSTCTQCVDVKKRTSPLIECFSHVVGLGAVPKKNQIREGVPLSEFEKWKQLAAAAEAAAVEGAVAEAAATAAAAAAAAATAGEGGGEAGEGGPDAVEMTAAT